MTGLKAGIEYGNISVRCMNQMGWSKPSNVVEVVTMPEIGPPSPPLLLMRYGKLTSSSFSFMWNGPLSSGGAPVTFYEINYLVYEEVMRAETRWLSLSRCVGSHALFAPFLLHRCR